MLSSSFISHKSLYSLSWIACNVSHISILSQCFIAVGGLKMTWQQSDWTACCNHEDHHFWRQDHQLWYRSGYVAQYGWDRWTGWGTWNNTQHFSGPSRSLPTERKISIPYSEADSGAGSDCSEDHEEVDNERKLIKPDMMAISQMLNFDEVRTMGY